MNATQLLIGRTSSSDTLAEMSAWKADPYGTIAGGERHNRARISRRALQDRRDEVGCCSTDSLLVIAGIDGLGGRARIGHDLPFAIGERAFT